MAIARACSDRSTWWRAWAQNTCGKAVASLLTMSHEWMSTLLPARFVFFVVLADSIVPDLSPPGTLRALGGRGGTGACVK